MSTTATKKQSAAIRERMQQIRNELPYDVDDARTQVQNLTDWKHYVRKHPGIVLPVVAAAAFLIVPKSRPEPKQEYSVSNRRGADRTIRLESASPEKRSLMTGVVSALMTVALRSATSVATQRLSHLMRNQ
ncbi:hypothetical protein [Roseimaritima ulvae]|uniref:DUF3618 domain-containing protein n=1 Tax=Roseimaritima ulvae TaxID=980254 RepID=A0A5B9QS78_9BACT|nr:hypothetical protein [Roseimaritima ulvae]QEG40759.1 hypothetical protein UC8_27760 [Roseimaritima ulvae]